MARRLSATAGSDQFAVSPAQLRAIDTATIRGGIPLGHTRTGALIGLDATRPVASRISLVTDIGVAKLVAIRALADGITVVVTTGRIQQWLPVRSAAELASDRLHLHELEEQSAVPVGSMDRPVLHLHDAGVAPQDPPAPRNAYQTVVHVLPGVHPHATNLLRSSNPVIVAGLLATQATALAEILGLPPAAAEQFAALPSGHLCVVSSDGLTDVTVRASQSERGV